MTKKNFVLKRLASYGISVIFVRDSFNFRWTSRSAGRLSIRSRLTAVYWPRWVELWRRTVRSLGNWRCKCIHAPCLIFWILKNLSLWSIKPPANEPSHLVNSRLTTSLQLVTNPPWTRMCARNRPAMPAVRTSTYVLPPSYFSSLRKPHFALEASPNWPKLH